MKTRPLPGLALLSLMALTACGDGGGAAGSGVIRLVLFETRSEIGVGIANVADAALADLNGDNHLDLAVTGLDGAVQILLGNGNGVFSRGQTVGAPGRPSDVRAADLDGDADSDLVVLRTEAWKASVLLNDGNANFTLAAELDLNPLATFMVLGDCNGDNRLDVVVAHQSTSDLSVFPGRGNGQFDPATALSLPAGSEPFGMTLGDVSGDGFQDLVVTDRRGARVAVFMAKPGGGHLPARIFGTGNAPVAVSVGDLNRDGRGDIAVSAFDDQALTLLINQGGMSFRSASVEVGGPPGNTLIDDVTGDGIDDMVVCVFERAAVSLFPGIESGGLGDEVQMAATGLPYRPLVGDVNEDNEPDLVVTGSGLDKLSLYLGRGGMLGGSINYETGIATPEFVTAADLNGDGQAEMAVAGRGSTKVGILALFENRQRNTREVRPVLTVDVGRTIFNVVRGDFDQDGRTDLAVAADGGVKILANLTDAGRLRFRPVPSDPARFLVSGQGPFEVASADMNRDGRPDLIVTDAYADEVIVLRARGAGFAYERAPFSIQVDGTPGGLAVADFTGDRIPDVAVARNTASRIDVLENDGAGMLSAWREVPVGALPNWLRTADFNHDGRADLVVSNAGADRITVLLGGPQAFFTLTLPAGDNPTALMSRDLNRDGNPDILVASLTGADFRVLLGDGRGGFPTQTAFPGTFKATSGDLADLDGDGLLDLVVASAETTRLSVYRNVSR